MGVFVFLGALAAIFILPSPYKMVAVMLLSVSCALGLFAVKESTFAEPITDLDGTNAYITATVTDEPLSDGERFFYKLRVDEAKDADVNNFKVLVTSHKNLGFKEFDCVAGEVCFYTSGSDTYKSEDIFIRAYVDANGGGLRVIGNNPTLYGYAISARRSVRSAVEERFSGDEGALITSVLIGDCSMLSAESLDNVKASGISHITVISGLHLSVLVSLMLSVFGSLFRSKRIASALTLPFVLVIMALAGFSPSVVRAGITCTIYLLGRVLLKRSDPLNSLCVAALLQCLANPFIVCSVSFLLSVFSTFGIIVLEPKMRKYVLSLSVCRFKPAANVAKAAITSLSAQLMTLPIVIITFGYVTPLSVVTNIIVGIPVALMVCLSAAGTLLCISGAFAYLGNLAMLISGLISKFILFVARVVSMPDFSTLTVASVAAFVILAAICVLIALTVALSKDLKLRLVSLMVVVTVAAGCLQYAFFESGVVKITVFSTYNGTSLVIQDGDFKAVIGASSDSASAKSVANSLKYSGTDKIDMLILPPDCNLLSGNAPDLLKRLSADKIIYSDKRLDIMKLEGAERLQYGDCEIKMTDRVWAEIRENHIRLYVCGRSVIIPTAAAKMPSGDIIIASYEFITTTCNAKYAIITGNSDLATAAADGMSGNGAVAYAVGNKYDLEVSVCRDRVSFARNY